MSTNAPTLEPGRPIVLRRGTVLTMDDAHQIVEDGDVLVVGERIEAVGPGLEVPGGDVRDRRSRRHRHAGHDRHAPAHVADGDARLRRGLDADPVLRLLLPRAGQDLPGAGHPRRQPAVRDRVARRRRDHDRRLVPRPADDRPRGRGRRRAGGRARPLRARLREPAAGPVGMVGVARLQALRQPALRRRRRHARLPDGVRRHRRPRVPGEGGLRGRARARRAGDHARRRVGRDQRRRHPADARARLHDAGEHLRPRRDARRGLLPPHRRHGRLGLRVDRERAERRPGLPADVGAAQARHPRVAVDGHERVVERRPVLGHAQHARRRPLARAPGGPRAAGHRHQPPPARRARRRLGDARREPGAAARLGGREPRAGQEGRRRPDQERATRRSCSPCCTPTGTSPSRRSAATSTPSLVNGRVVKHAGPARRHRPRARRGGRSRRRSSSRCASWATGVDRRHAPGGPGDEDARQPLYVHAMGRRNGAVEESGRRSREHDDTEGQGERGGRADRAGGARGDPRGARAPPGARRRSGTPCWRS